MKFNVSVKRLGTVAGGKLTTATHFGAQVLWIFDKQKAAVMRDFNTKKKKKNGNRKKDNWALTGAAILFER